MHVREIDEGNFSNHMHSCETYLYSRTGCYEWRSIRYKAAAEIMQTMGLSDNSLVVDVGAGWTELDYYLRTECQWRGRYWPVDGQFDGTDLNKWVPPRQADFFVALEILEHLFEPAHLLSNLVDKAICGVICSVPNPRTTDVLGMDSTHITVMHPEFFTNHGFTVQERSFYGVDNDSLFAYHATS